MRGSGESLNEAKANGVLQSFIVHLPGHSIKIQSGEQFMHTAEAFLQIHIIEFSCRLAVCYCFLQIWFQSFVYIIAFLSKVLPGFRIVFKQIKFMKLLNDIVPSFIILGSLQNMQQHPKFKTWCIGNEYGIVGKSGDAFLQDNSRRLVPVTSECPFGPYNCIRIYYPEYGGVGFR